VPVLRRARFLKLILWRVKNRRIDTSVVFNPSPSKIRRPISARVRSPSRRVTQSTARWPISSEGTEAKDAT